MRARTAGEPGGRARPSVLLIREWERQTSASGCCAHLKADFLIPDRERSFPERRAIMEAMGPLYRDLRERYGDAVQVQVLDPRNFLSMLPLLVRDFRAHGVGLAEALRTLCRLPVTGVVVNGRLLASGRWPDADELEVVLGPPPNPWEVQGGLA